ncbi:MAG: hypothetical protein NC218_11525 [Acetobacter sp.]|nr:hypothetical protein [Acetobacter sp.]
MVKEICGTANGCFTVKTTNDKHHLFTANGTFLQSNIEANAARVLDDGSCFLHHCPRKNSPLSHSFVRNRPVWDLYTPGEALRLQDLSDCTIYANNWYCVTKDDRRQLYRADHTLAAENFTQCAVFPNGYALRTNATYYKYADWQLFLPDGTFVRNAHSVEAILGNGLLLINSSPEQYRLYDIENDELIVSKISAYQPFLNGKFVLSFEEDCFGTTNKLYAPDGHRLSTGTVDAVFLPDGRFIQFHNQRISALYRPNGLLHSDEVWSYEIAGNYYLLSYEGEDTLYNDKSEDLGSGYGIVGIDENFSLFENEQAYHLFNQYGEVLTLPMPD